MKMRRIFANSVAAALIAVLTPQANLAVAAATDAKPGQTAPGNAQIEELQGQIRAMQQQLDKLSATQAAASQHSQMRQHWQSMQDYMRHMQGMPWMRMGPPTSGPPPMGPGMMGPGMMGRGMMGPRAQGDWMMGCPMTGMPGAAWQLPPGMTAEQYRSQMFQNMQRMHDQMAKIQSTTDPAERQRLLQEHWQDMYRNMQSMRGMGWMWGGPMANGQAAKPLPEPASAGAKLVSTYCTQCHAAPTPELHTAAEWSAVTARMSTNISNFNASGWRGVSVPSEADMKTILGYLQKFAR